MNNKYPLVSVIIPLYNSEHYIAHTIESVLKQTYKNIELIVIDDGSTDSSLTIAKRYEKGNIRVYHQTNQGAQIARNFGFSVSKGDYIQYLDSDDYLTPNKIKMQVKQLEQSDSMTIATSSVYIKNGCDCVLWSMPEIYRNFNNGFDLLVDLWRYFIPSLPHGSYLIPKNLIESSGGWDETLLKNQDGEFFSRVLKQAKEVVYIAEEGQVWTMRSNSISHEVSSRKIESVLRSYVQIANLMLSKEDSVRVRQAIAVAYGSFIINDSDYKHANKALKILKELKIKPNYRIKSLYFRILLKILHPKTAMLIFTKIQCLRGKKVYFTN